MKFNNGAGNVASEAGHAAYYYGVGGDAADGDGYEDSIVTQDRTDGFMTAGVFQAVIADLSYGWIQIKGPATMLEAMTAGSDGNALQFTLEMEVKSVITRPSNSMSLKERGYYEISGLAWSGGGRSGLRQTTG